jgi:hypothetical protein
MPIAEESIAPKVGIAPDLTQPSTAALHYFVCKAVQWGEGPRCRRPSPHRAGLKSLHIAIYEPQLRAKSCHAPLVSAHMVVNGRTQETQGSDRPPLLSRIPVLVVDMSPIELSPKKNILAVNRATQQEYGIQFGHERKGGIIHSLTIILRLRRIIAAVQNGSST